MKLSLREHFTFHGFFFLKNDIIIAHVVPYKLDNTLFDIEIPAYLPDFALYNNAGPFESIEHAKQFCELFAEKIDFRVHMRYPEKQTLLGILKKCLKP